MTLQLNEEHQQPRVGSGSGVGGLGGGGLEGNLKWSVRIQVPQIRDQASRFLKKSCSHDRNCNCDVFIAKIEWYGI